MIRRTVSSIRSGLLPVLASLALLGVLAGCTVNSTTSNALGFPTTKVDAARVTFHPLDTGAAKSTAIGSMGYLMVPQARSDAEKYNQLLDSGFRDRFPAEAAAYGLSVSPTAPAMLVVAITNSKTSCSGHCVTRVYISAMLYDASKRPIWQFNSDVGQSTIFAEISDKRFDAFAAVLLEGMKKDGIIGRP